MNRLLQTFIQEHINEHLGYASENEFELIKICMVGSRVNGVAKQTSDLDIAIQYRGFVREDAVFYALNHEPLIIEDICIDFIPYSEEKGNEVQEDATSIILFEKARDLVC